MCISCACLAGPNTTSPSLLIKPCRTFFLSPFLTTPNAGGMGDLLPPECFVSVLSPPFPAKNSRLRPPCSVPIRFSAKLRPCTPSCRHGSPLFPSSSTFATTNVNKNQPPHSALFLASPTFRLISSLPVLSPLQSGPQPNPPNNRQSFPLLAKYTSPSPRISLHKIRGPPCKTTINCAASSPFSPPKDSSPHDFSHPYFPTCPLQ